MAGRILPIALATVAGVAIGVATFDSEFKEQRKKRLEEEYKRDLAAVSASGSESAPAVKIDTQHISEASNNDARPSGLSSLLGAWAWRRGGNTNAPPSKESETKSTSNESN